MEVTVWKQCFNVLLALFSTICNIPLTKTQVTLLPDLLDKLIKIKELIFRLLGISYLFETVVVSDLFTTI